MAHGIIYHCRVAVTSNGQKRGNVKMNRAYFYVRCATSPRAKPPQTFDRNRRHDPLVNHIRGSLGVVT